MAMGVECMSGYFLIIDGGTSNTRVTLLNEQQIVLDVEKRAAGVGQTAIDGHNMAIKSAIKDAIDTILKRNHLAGEDIHRCIAYGMLTSNVGLVEIPHCVAPVGLLELHHAMQRHIFLDVASFSIDFIPGVRNTKGEVDLTNFSSMDMMRGEETEALGLWSLLSLREACVVILPGSHNKFVSMDGHGNILGCMTSMSGELLDVLVHHSILADAVQRRFLPEEEYDLSFLLAGYQEAERAGLGRAAFSSRILRNVGSFPSEKVSNYLLGVVLQSDAAALKTFCGNTTPLYVAGKQPLQRAIADLLREAGYLAVHEAAKSVHANIGIEGALKIALC
jgi:2-dehydro-3-deoxygalactonokinase